MLRSPLNSTYLFHQRVHPLARTSFTSIRFKTTTSTVPRKLRSSYLYVPSSDQRKLDKSLESNSDVIIYDLEDSVGPESKADARERLREFLLNPETRPRSEIAVRINALSTPDFEKDINALAKIDKISTIVLPKVNSREELVRICKKLSPKLSPATPPTRLVASIESALPLMDLGRLASYKGKSKKVVLSALLFAAEDYCASTSVIRTKDLQELHVPRSMIAMAAQAYGLEAIDMVCTNYKSTKQLQYECDTARQLGFTGKQAIHPDQVEPILKAFAPTDKEIERALKIVSQMEASRAQGKGAFGLEDGSGGSEMIDEPMLKQAQIVLEKAAAAGKYKP